eukprot:s259_g1.t1
MQLVCSMMSLAVCAAGDSFVSVAPVVALVRLDDSWPATVGPWTSVKAQQGCHEGSPLRANEDNPTLMEYGFEYTLQGRSVLREAVRCLAAACEWLCPSASPPAPARPGARREKFLDRTVPDASNSSINSAGCF